MPELKRTFNAAKMNRDIDDRLLHPGEYRYAMNVNIGESEGGDIGAVENLKGNELIAGQDNLNGTTIGVVRDPNNDRIYWFNKGDTVDGIYEYDERTGMVNPILLDQVSNPLQKPSCVPNFTLPVQRFASDTVDRPMLASFPTAPRGYCSIAGRPNTGQRADGTAHTPGFDFPMDSICQAAPPPTSNLAVSVPNVTGTAGDGDLTLVATATNPTGTVTFEWFSDSARSTSLGTGTVSGSTSSLVVTDPGTAQTITRYVTATDTITSANGQGNAVFTAPGDISFTVAVATNIPNTDSSGGFTFTGTPPVTLPSNLLGVQPREGFQWAAIPNVAIVESGDDTATITPSTITQPTAGSDVGVSTSLSGTASTNGGTYTLTWSGSTIADPPTTTTHSITATLNTGLSSLTRDAAGQGDLVVGILETPASTGIPFFIGAQNRNNNLGASGGTVNSTGTTTTAGSQVTIRTRLQIIHTGSAAPATAAVVVTGTNPAAIPTTASVNTTSGSVGQFITTYNWDVTYTPTADSDTTVTITLTDVP